MFDIGKVLKYYEYRECRLIHMLKLNYSGQKKQ